MNAGHNPAIVARRNGSLHWLETGGAPVGMFRGLDYKESVVLLESGDLVIAYTDGVVEATNPAGEEWGVHGLLKAIASRPQCGISAEDLVRLIFNFMDDFSKGLQTDDATLAVVQVNRAFPR